MRIVELGPVPVFARVRPTETTWIATGAQWRLSPDAPTPALRFHQYAKVLAAVRDPDAAFIACHVPGPDLARHSIAGAAYDLLMRAARAPIVALDWNDAAALTPLALQFLARGDRYFKRELPRDRTALLTAVPRSARTRLQPHLRKIQPLSLGLASWRIASLPRLGADKTVDLFFCGALHSAVRQRGAALIAELRAEGFRIDVSEETLDRAAYLARLSQAHLAWSPEGFGWQCFRHFEAAAAESVPVINRGGIEMPHPFREGEHCFYYEADGRDLLRVIRGALADRAQLRTMGRAAREHVEQHHTHEALVEQILQAVNDSGRHRRG